MRRARSFGLLAGLAVAASACAALIDVNDLVPAEADAGSGDGAAPRDDAATAGDAGPLRDGDVGADAATLLELATGQGEIGAVAVGLTHVYWSSITNGTVSRAPKGGGGSVTVLASGPEARFVRHLALSATDLVWASAECCSGAVAHVTTTGIGPAAPPVQILATAEEPRGIAIDGAYALWADRNSSRIERVLLDGGGREVVATAQGGGPMALAADNGIAFWIVDFSGQVQRTTNDGGVASIGASGQSGREIVLDGTFVYWGAAIDPGSAGRIARARRIGIGGVEIVGAAGGEPTGLAVDGTTVYWTAIATGGGGAVYACNVTGCPPEGPRVVAADQRSPHGLAVDGDAIYWGADGRILRLTKK